MLVLDTDHLVELDRGSAEGVALQRKLEDANDEIATAIISAEEQFRGWLAQIHRQRDPRSLLSAGPAPGCGLSQGNGPAPKARRATWTRPGKSPSAAR